MTAGNVIVAAGLNKIATPAIYADQYYFRTNGQPFYGTGFGTGNITLVGDSIGTVNTANVINIATNSLVATANITASNVIATHYGNAIGTNATYTGNVIVTGNIGGGFGTINTNYLYLVRITAANVIANLTTTTYVLDSAASGVIAAQTLTLPTVAEDGRTLTFSALCPITTTTTVGGTVKYLWANTFATGNVVAKLQFSSGQAAWLRVG